MPYAPTMQPLLARCMHAGKPSPPAKPAPQLSPAAARHMLTALGRHLWPTEPTLENNDTKKRVVMSMVSPSPPNLQCRGAGILRPPLVGAQCHCQ